VTLLLATIVASLTRTTPVERPSIRLSVVDSIVGCRFAALIHLVASTRNDE
jgi:hypothetical protein